MQAYEGYFENGSFHSAGRVIEIPVREKIVIVLDEYTQAPTNEERWETMKKLRGIVKSDIDEKAELAKARIEKYEGST
ncbi:MAG: hypothetical protein FWG90_06160 [Oscillospiraceae bacterium]|nr:hypothetical protein [Oscillospiraceae bacterium]